MIDKSKQIKRANVFYIVYTDDTNELPIGYFDNLEEVCRYFGKTKNQLVSLISKHKNKYKKGIRLNGNYYNVSKWHINGQEVQRL